MGPAIFETSNQLWVFLFTIYGGIVLGVLYDLCYVIRVFLHGKHIMTVFFDIVYWILATALSFALLYYACEGEFRYYDALGFGIGAALWLLGPGKAVKWTQRKAMHGLHIIWSKFKGTAVYKFIFK